MEKNILVIDDDATLLNSLSRFFKGRDIVVTTAVSNSVEEAIAEIELQQPEIVLLDHNLKISRRVLKINFIKNPSPLFYKKSAGQSIPDGIWPTRPRF